MTVEWSRYVTINKKRIINLDERLGSFRIAELSKTKSSDQLAIAVNERMAYVYPIQTHIKVKEIVDLIQDDSRLDTISWKEGEWVEVIQGGSKRVKIPFRF